MQLWPFSGQEYLRVKLLDTVYVALRSITLQYIALRPATLKIRHRSGVYNVNSDHILHLFLFVLFTLNICLFDGYLFKCDWCISNIPALDLSILGSVSVSMEKLGTGVFVSAGGGWNYHPRCFHAAGRSSVKEC